MGKVRTNPTKDKSVERLRIMGGICEICGCDLTNSNRAYYEQYYNQKIVKVYYDVCKDCHDKKSKHPLNRHERRKIKALRGE